MSQEPVLEADPPAQDPPVDSPPVATDQPSDAPTPERLWAGKYQAPEKLEEGYVDLLTQHSAVARENELLREQLERMSQPQPGPTPASPLDNSAVTAEAHKLMDQGRYLEANELMLNHSLAKMRTEVRGEIDGVKRALQVQTVGSAIGAMQADKARFPNFEKLNVEMAALAKVRLTDPVAGQAIVNAYGGYDGFFKALYYEVEGQHPELRRGGAALPPGVLTPGGGGTPRPRTPPPAPTPGSKTADAKRKATLRVLGLPENPYQGDRSSFDLANEEKWRNLQELQARLSGQG